MGIIWVFEGLGAFHRCLHSWLRCDCNRLTDVGWSQPGIPVEPQHGLHNVHISVWYSQWVMSVNAVKDEICWQPCEHQFGKGTTLFDGKVGFDLTISSEESAEWQKL